MNNCPSIDENPEVIKWTKAEREAATPEEKRIAHNTMIAVIKAIQYERGQRTRDNYRKAS